MPNTITWHDVLLRLGLAAVAGIIVGFNRGQHGRAAGPRTMLLVCAASALGTPAQTRRSRAVAFRTTAPQTLEHDGVAILVRKLR